MIKRTVSLVLMVAMLIGFSVNVFAAFHPDKIKAIASGGTLDDMILP